MTRQTLLTDWNITRIVRLVLGFFFLMHAVNEKDYFSGLIALLLFYQAITNTGCFGATCSTPLNNKKGEGIQEIDVKKIDLNK